MIHHIDNVAAFEQGLIHDESTVIIKFEAEWCTPCKAVSPIVEEVARNNPEVSFYAIDIDLEGADELVSKHKVRSLPTFVKLRGGIKIDEVQGTITKTDLNYFITS